MKTTNLLRVGIVVTDLDAAMDSYRRIHGITDWDVSHIDAGQTSSAVSYGRTTSTTPGTWRAAIGTTRPAPSATGPGGGPSRPVTFELVEPTGGESPFNEYLLTKGPGICFIRVLATGGDDVAGHFDRLGIPAVYSADIDGSRRTFYDTRDALGGFLVEMVTGAAEPATDATDREPTSGVLPPLQGIHHFGVIVDNVLGSLEAYRDIFGITRFECKTWQTGHGRLDDPRYRGEKVDHGYFTAQGSAGDFGFEIIQCKHGPSHYNREFSDIRGPGIHHMFSWMTTDEDEWRDTVAAMTGAGHGLCMGSPLRGHAAEFGYFDVFDELGGYLIEGVLRRRPPAPEHMRPDWVVDFGEQR
ncbi:hypothetical protein JIM95_003405 [Corynebacterium sp. CCM 8835]|uniref:VOC domain-containing protein n=1 Tax=Corynebacterium antarcticum TaxID=2800405 RepID=A0A9Q4CB68_9CORY|nr:hypothetical protein [Corynebacterium antarcticum]MCK7641975.1 hypothetical protein [Corynebacterium antarcticum]MCK7659922.1 hypothetical protein [Corynebacterium antarcticum]MCL0245199.1 hypothetical protein [Corynebacterium antarcticum]MCX7492964.1 hypothetical protein [Corynebacterium antarcticum]MCX7537599.1 hypothetical protein [Corynebacterium antarcticum]